ncbi:MAG TPA: methyltransferase domain-containing protein [Anaerolineaceae bacterium]|nr:methyltransferase domain-containing protein [Anaerolineaceae bacterium]
MASCQCQGIEETFSRKAVTKELARYRQKGPELTTRMLVEALKAAGIRGATLLDIGGGVGAIQHELLAAGAVQATDVDASWAYLEAAEEEARRRHLAGRIQFAHGNFVDLAPQIPPAEVVTLDRVICCFDDMERLVDLSAARAEKLYGLVYPRDAWWAKFFVAVLNLIQRIQGSPFRSFVHPTQAVEGLVQRRGLKRRYYRRTLVWQVAVYSR